MTRLPVGPNIRVPVDHSSSLKGENETHTGNAPETPKKEDEGRNGIDIHAHLGDRATGEHCENAIDTGNLVEQTKQRDDGRPKLEVYTEEAVKLGVVFT